MDCGAVVRSLLEKRLVRMLGKKDEPGRPILYGTSSGFLEVFGLRSLRELPTLREFVELSADHQRLVEERAPSDGETAARALRSYLEDLDHDPGAEAWADDVAQGHDSAGREGPVDDSAEDEATADPHGEVDGPKSAPLG